jgi:hypothetical protein
LLEAGGLEDGRRGRAYAATGDRGRARGAPAVEETAPQLEGAGKAGGPPRAVTAMVTALAPWRPGAADMPGSARWPRLLTAPHPAATGSYGAECAAWGESRGLHPRPSTGSRFWQRLALAGALEHDAAGALCWPVAVISGPRQCGKSWLERMICGWRMSQAGRFGGQEQAVLHVAHKLIAAQEVWRPAARWAKQAGGYRVREANGEQAIEAADGSRWLLQAANDGAGVSFSLCMALIDEGWRVKRAVYEEAIEPAMAEADSPQTWLVSTAGTAESDLMMTYRAAAIATLEDPGDTFLIEYSAPPDPGLDIDDPEVWQAAQPHWDERREAWVTRKREQAGERAFRQQALNQWVPSLTPPMLEEGTYGRVASRRAPSGAISFGAEVAEDHSRAVIIAYGGGVAEVIEDRPRAGWVAGRLGELAARHNPAAVGVDGSGPAKGLAAELKSRDGISDRLVVLSASDMAAASGLLLDALTSSPPAVGLRDHPLLEAAITSARKRRSGGAWAWDRGDAGLALIAVTCGVWASAHAPALAEDPMVFV